MRTGDADETPVCASLPTAIKSLSVATAAHVIVPGWVGVPCFVPFADMLKGVGRLRLGLIRAEAVRGAAPVLTLDLMMLDAEEVAHGCTVSARTGVRRAHRPPTGWIDSPACKASQ